MKKQEKNVLEHYGPADDQPGMLLCSYEQQTDDLADSETKRSNKKTKKTLTFHDNVEQFE